ncbi:SRPBCC family protein [Parvibaculum sp.]|jgi:phenylpropionate dioxygenase-like ring-hydroxylating dioxygenase large terminal subunit|uniref:aromatic ring-hydroxylating oxygenase subunit alpha n=1 Tax=Parvibaculum sp. TaxID=2024848 RepID=UPI000C55A99F|nr:SRPBCC family protein [Parvibaculum sp.]MAM95270.1 (2Fe-2S)-binding protein [Parvibaculum sp.]HCX66513.1 (2Fe-2S)-binding protein [Rhodobiaceae bacterium]|tara:strand:- start:2841 stop:4025 length:1185 start_codon:yes stop_codon:yes gene_type:complete
MSTNILTDAFFEGFSSSLGDVTEAETLPPACYTDEEFFDFEKDALFNREWLCVGREDWVKNPGDYFTATHIGEPLIISRTREGELKAMSAVCQHRAMLVAEGRGNTKAFVCPYHHWTYGLDGRLVGAPAMSKTCDFDRNDVSLPEIKTEIWEGFIFVNFDADALPLAPRLTTVSEALVNYDLPNAEGAVPDEPQSYPWNWKVMMENNNDGYHATRLHKGPLHDFIPSELATFPEMPEGSAGYLRFNGTLHPDAAFNPLQKAVLPVFPKLTSEERHRAMFANIPPSLSLVITSDMVIYLILHAESANSHSMTIGWLVAPGAMSEPLFQERLDMNMRTAMEITEQDLHVDKLVQIGLKSRFSVRGRYSWQERAQSDLNHWLVTRYQQEWQRRKAAS